MNSEKINYYIKGLQEPPIYVYTEDEINKYQEFIKEKYGEYTLVYHELYSPDIHLDILVVPPSEERNYCKLITRGMGAYQMNIPSQLKDYELERAELVIYLPPDWDIDFSKEENGWIAKLLKQIARLPIDEKSWVGFGHTLSHNDTESYASNTKLSSALLLEAIDEKNDCPLDFKLENKGRINFYQVFPLYKEELEYKMKYGTEKLLDRLEDVSLVVDINRKNYCKDLEILKDNINMELEEEIEK